MFELWHSHQQMMCVLIDKLLKTQIVECSAVATWIFSKEMNSEFTKMYLWEILHLTIKKMNKHVIKLGKRGVTHEARTHDAIETIYIVFTTLNLWFIVLQARNWMKRRRNYRGRNRRPAIRKTMAPTTSARRTIRVTSPPKKWSRKWKKNWKRQTLIRNDYSWSCSNDSSWYCRSIWFAATLTDSITIRTGIAGPLDVCSKSFYWCVTFFIYFAIDSHSLTSHHSSPCDSVSITSKCRNTAAHWRPFCSRRTWIRTFWTCSSSLWLCVPKPVYSVHSYDLRASY